MSLMGMLSSRPSSVLTSTVQPISACRHRAGPRAAAVATQGPLSLTMRAAGRPRRTTPIHQRGRGLEPSSVLLLCMFCCCWLKANGSWISPASDPHLSQRDIGHVNEVVVGSFKPRVRFLLDNKGDVAWNDVWALKRGKKRDLGMVWVHRFREGKEAPIAAPLLMACKKRVFSSFRAKKPTVCFSKVKPKETRVSSANMRAHRTAPLSVILTPR